MNCIQHIMHTTMGLNNIVGKQLFQGFKLFSPSLSPGSLGGELGGMQ